jgi:hypothetical protein
MHSHAPIPCLSQISVGLGQCCYNNRTLFHVFHPVGFAAEQLSLPIGLAPSQFRA